jgi:hypothetical protein
MFEDETPHGTISLPDLNLISAEAIREANGKGETERVWWLLEALAPEAMEIVDLMPSPYLADLLERWGQHSALTVGDLFSIDDLIRKHSEHLESDLIDKGMRLRHFPSDEFTWHDLKVIISHLSEHSSLFAAVYPDRAGWDRKVDLQASTVDMLRILAWQPTADGRKGRNVPQQIPRPGVTPPRRDGSNPKPSKLSVLKERFSARYAVARRPTAQPDRAQKLNDLFGRG